MSDSRITANINVDGREFTVACNMEEGEMEGVGTPQCSRCQSLATGISMYTVEEITAQDYNPVPDALKLKIVRIVQQKLYHGRPLCSLCDKATHDELDAQEFL